MDNIVPFGTLGTNAPVIQVETLPDIEQEMIDTINRVNEYALNRGSLGGFDTGFQLLNEAI
jgi:hypothetical protein